MTDLTPALIRDLPAGPALDAIVAERVMGWRSDGSHTADGLPVYQVPETPNRPVWLRDWRPSADIVAAMDVLCKARGPTLTPFQIRGDEDDYTVYLFRYDRGLVSAVAGTISLAICRAALILVSGV